LTTCNKCGDCCSVVALRYTKRMLLARVKSGELDPKETKWIMKNLRRISRTSAARILGRQPNKSYFFYVCTIFDPEENVCSDYEDRPRMCKGFPWYGRTPDKDVIANYPNCSYRADLM